MRDESFDDRLRPQAPPPGVSTRTRSPGIRSRLVFPGSFERLPFFRVTKFIPTAPSPPPANPHGASTRRSVRRLTFQSTMHSISRTSPSPPEYLPRPPDPRRIRYSVTRIG